MGKKANMDNHFKRRLEQLEVQPPGRVWERLDATLSARRRKIIPLWVKIGGAAAVLTVGFITGWFLNTQLQEKNEVVVENIGQEVNRSEEQNLAQIGHESQKKQPQVITDNLVITQKKPLKKMTGKKAVVREKEESFALLDLISFDGLSESIHTLSELIIKHTSHEERHQLTAGLSAAEKEIIEQNIAEINPKRVERLQLSLGVQAGAVGTLNEGERSNTLDMMNYSSASNSLNMGTGTAVMVEVKTGKRLSIQSGVMYSRMNQKNSDLIYENNMAYYDNNSSTGTDMVYTSPGVSNNWVSNGAWGIMNLREIPSESAKAGLVQGGLENDNAYYSSQDIKLQAEYIEIPLIVKYKLIDKRFDINLLGGMSANLLIGNDVYINDSNGKRSVGEIDNMSGLTYSSTFGMGLDYNLSNKLSLNLEPKLKYYLGSLTDKSYIKMQPWVFGIYAGVSYNF